MHPRHHMRLGAILTILGLVTLAVPGIASAHAELDSITPADKSTVAGPPSSIVAVFTEQLDPAKSSLTLVDASGAVIAQGGTVDPNQTLTLNLDPSKIAPGAYSVRWVSSSVEDGDLARGTTTFTVTAAPSAPPSVQPSSSAGPSVGGSATPSVPSVGPSVSPSAAPTTPGTSTSDAVIPIVVALIALAALALWLLRGRARAGR